MHELVAKAPFRKHAAHQLGCDFKIRTFPARPPSNAANTVQGAHTVLKRAITVRSMNRLQGDPLGYPRKSTLSKLRIVVC